MLRPCQAPSVVARQRISKTATIGNVGHMTYAHEAHVFASGNIVEPGELERRWQFQDHGNAELLQNILQNRGLARVLTWGRNDGSLRSGQRGLAMQGTPHVLCGLDGTYLWRADLKALMQQITQWGDAV